MTRSKATSVQRNALVHGVYAEDFVLPWESQQDFVELHGAFRADLEPDGPTEEDAVLAMVVLCWKRRRLAIGSQLSYRRHPNAAALTDASKTGWDGVAEYVKATSSQTDSLSNTLRNLARSHSQALHTSFLKVNEVLAKLKLFPPQNEELQRSAELQGDRSNEQLDALTNLTRALDSIGTEVITPILKLIEGQDIEQNVAERAFRSDIIEREVKLGAFIDAQMGKALVRLVQLKEYKRLYKNKQVSG